ncbi:phasin family protein [Lysobacter sp. A3-1-A15]|uniref:phasin family protein n=1 Tax=Novilysobacter viscosus TaxID=3098602 RepID=UPI002ED7E37B
MYPQFNEQFANATRQFADTAAQINRLTLENAQAVLGLQLSAIEERADATFSFWNEAAQVRDMDGMKAIAPKGVQLARENVERAVSTGQEAFGRTLKTQEAIGEIAKSQIEATAKATRDNVEANVEKATKATGKSSK